MKCFLSVNWYIRSIDVEIKYAHLSGNSTVEQSMGNSKFSWSSIINQISKGMSN